jgi:ABC-2 type transport system permease protein
MMNQVLCVARREYLATVRTKGFILGLLVAPLLMFGALLVLVLVQDQRDTRDRRVAVLDHTGRIGLVIVEAAARRNAEAVHDARSGKKVAPAYLFELSEWDGDGLEEQRLALSERVRRGELHAFLEIGSEVLQPRGDSEQSRISYHSLGAALDELRGWVANPINQELRRWRLAEAGVNEAQVPHLFHWATVEPMSLVKADAVTGEVQAAERRDEAQAIVGPVGLAFVMYMMVLMAALPMLTAVMEEKTQRIAEVLLGAARPFSLMSGKLLSALAVALTGSLVYVSLGVGSGLYLAAIEWIPWRLLPWFVLFMVPAILMFAALSAALGSACNDPKDAQNLTFPVILPVLLPLFFLAPVLREPQSTIAVALSLFPPFTPTLLLVRLGLPNGAPLWQGVVGWVGLMVSAGLAIWVAGRLFRVALLIQGHSPRFRDLVRWSIRG